MKKRNNIKQDQPGFLNYSSLMTLGEIILCCGAAPCIVRGLAAFLASAPNSSTTLLPSPACPLPWPPVVTKKNIASHCHYLLYVTLPTTNLRTTDLDN